MIEDNYRVEYVFCTCPACKKKIPLKVYAKVPILRVEIDETCGEERDKMNKDTYILEIIAKAREWQKTKSITTSSDVCKMLNDLADKYLENEENAKD